jgi:hypothetical protein
MKIIKIAGKLIKIKIELYSLKMIISLNLHKISVFLFVNQD